MSTERLLIPIPEVTQRFNDCDPRTIVAACKRHNIPIVRLSQRLHGLTPANLDLLMERASGATADAD